MVSFKFVCFYNSAVICKCCCGLFNADLNMGSNRSGLFNAELNMVPIEVVYLMLTLTWVSIDLVYNFPMPITNIILSLVI